MASTLILGGGFGGLAVAGELKKRMPAHEVALIDRSSEFVIGAAKAWVATGEKRPREISHRRDRIRSRGIRFLQTEVQAIDPANRRAVTSQGTFQADHMVVALGADLNLAAVPGLAECAQHFYSVEAAAKLREALLGFEGGKVVLAIPRTPFKCPAGPYEGMLLLADWIRRHPPKKQTTLSIQTVEGSPMATGGPEIGEAVKAQLRRAGIAFHNQRKIARVDPGAREIRFEDGTAAEYDLLLAVPPHEAPAAIRNSPLAGPNGWIPVEPKTCATRFPDVYAIGDCCSIPLPGRFRPDVALSLPKAGVLAEAMGLAVARNIAHSYGKGPADEFDGGGYCYLETGDMHAMRAQGAFFAMPHPTMVSRVPDMTQFEEKKTWIAETVERLLGPARSVWDP